MFQTSAPPDFQRQILERVAQCQHTHRRWRMGWRSLLAWWPEGRAWGVRTRQSHRRWPGHAIAMAGCCGLVLGTSLTWWAVRTDPVAPPIPELLVSRVVSPPGTYSETDEIVELAKVAASRGGLYASHIRGEAGSLMEAVTALEVAP